MLKIIIKTIFIFFLTILLKASSENKELEISADTMEWKREENIAIALGNAKAVQDNKLLYANRIVIFFNKGVGEKKIIKLDAAGKVKFIRGDQVATGENATYFIKSEKVVIKGNVKLQRENSIMVGEELTIDLKSSSSKLISSNKSGKVRAKYKASERRDEKN